MPMPRLSLDTVRWPRADQGPDFAEDARRGKGSSVMHHSLPASLGWGACRRAAYPLRYGSVWAHQMRHGAPLCKRHPLVRHRERPLLRLWSRKGHLALGAKDVAVEAGNPATPARRDVEITDGGLDMWRDAVPIKLRISIHEVRRRFIAELLVQSTLFKFVVKGVGFSQIIRVAKLTDEIGGSQQ